MRQSSVRTSAMLFSAAALVTLTACASAPPGGASTKVSSAPIGGGGSSRGVGLEMTVRNDGAQSSFAADPSAVFAALEASYIALAIPLSKRDDAARMIGNDGLKIRRQLGKIELRRAFDCGSSGGMPNSETYTITAGISTTVTSDGTNQSTITTVIDAQGENPNYPGSGVRCSSAGTIEDAIAKEIRTRLNNRP
jgi:hypothetical protein